MPEVCAGEPGIGKTSLAEEFARLAAAETHIKDGRLHVLAVLARARSRMLPDIPTMTELGYRDMEADSWVGVLVPAKTPKAIIDKLNIAMNAALADKAVQDTLLSAGVEPLTSTPDELRAFVASETKKWADIVKAAHIEPE